MADCTWTLEATTDGGVTFTPRTLPAATSDVWQKDPLYVFDATHLLVENRATLPGTAGAAMGGSGWVSSDGGLSWSVVSPTPVTMVDRFPAGTLVTQASDPTGTRAEPLLALRADGSAVELTGTPPDASMAASIEPNGSFFIESGNDGLVYVSTDSGHTWRLSDLPGTGDPVILGAVGSLIFATAGPDDTDTNFVPRLMSSSDRGLTWHQVPLPRLTRDATPPLTPEEEDQGGYTVYSRTGFAVTQQAGVLFNDGARTWRMAPGSHRFVADDQAFPIIFLINAGPVALAVSADPAIPHAQARLYISVDGLRWRPVGSS